jgi:hypothetical protein
MTEEKPNEINIEQMEKDLVLFVLRTRKSLEDLRDIVNQIGLVHLGLLLDCAAKDADLYLKDHEKQKADGNVK